MIPTTLEECFKTLQEQLPLEDKQIFLSISRNGLHRFHHSLGRAMRNEYKLWGTDPNPLRDVIIAKGIIHPDDMSTYIMEYCWDRFKEEEAKVDPIEVKVANKDW